MTSDPFYGDETDELELWLGARWNDSSALSSIVPRRTCDHCLDPFELSNGGTLYASAYYSSWDREWEPDLAVYLDSAWQPATVAFHIGWPDFGIPRPPLEKVLRIAKVAVSESHAGRTVEVGCLGSHGRTGTFLALCELIAQGTKPSAPKAIARVRDLHCSRAIENKRQEAYISAASGYLRSPANRQTL